MFQRLIHYLESGTDDVHGYVKELKEAEQRINMLDFDYGACQAHRDELKQQLQEARDLLKRCEHKLVYYLSGEPAIKLAEAIKEHLKNHNL